MNKVVISIVTVIVGCVILALAFGGALVGNYNDYTRIENRVAAVQNDNKNVLDNTRKSIREAASVSDKEVEALEKIITGYADARGPNDAGDGALVTVGAIREAVPSIQGVETLKNLQNIIVAGRKDWQFSQTKLLDLKREADDMYNVFPGNVILSLLGKKRVEVTIVTSTETEGNFASGKDDTNWIQTKGEK